MSDVLDEAYGVMQCKQCPWYKSCVIPMRLTAEDIRRQLEASATGTGPSPQADLGIQNLLSNMARRMPAANPDNPAPIMIVS